MSIDITPLRDFVGELTGRASPIQWGVQIAIIAVALGLAWLLSKRFCGRFHASPRWKFGAGEFQRVMFPLMALALVWLTKLVMEHVTQPVTLLGIATSLLIAWLVIRIAVYILGHVLPQGATLRLVVRIIAWVAWIGVALHITGLMPEVLDALDEIGFTVGKNKTHVSLLLIVQAISAMAVTLTIAMWLARVTEGRVLAAQSVEMNTRVVIVKIVNTAAVIVAIMVALPMAGIDITALSVFGGAVGVGLGFGLQKVASNYVSGFIVLLERSLRIGDVITIDNRRGVVQAIESRYTVIKAGDGTETIIPNEDLITKQVVHHTYTDPKVATVLPVTVSYESDAEAACEALAEVGKRNTRVIGDPSPQARVVGLGDNGIQMELTVWISDPEKGESDLRSELLQDVLRTFAGKGIRIASPRREIRRIPTPETEKTSGTSMA